MNVGELTSFIPRRLVHAVTHGSVQHGPVSLRAAVVFVDVSSFSMLASTLAARHGSGGAELLSNTLNTLFAALLPCVRAEGGEIAKFAGDGMLAVFPSRGDDDADAVAAAGRAALAMVARVADRPPLEGVTLALRAAVVVGTLQLLPVGGFRDRWDLALLGDAIQQLGDVWHGVARDTVGLSESAAMALGARGTVDRRGEVITLRAVRDALDAPLPEDNDDVPPPPSLAPWLPQAVSARAEAPFTGWLAELRSLSPMFVALPGLEVSPEAVAAAVRVAQEEIAAHLGVLHEVNTDEKGLSLTAAFGLPGAAVERPAENAIRCAEALLRRYESRGVKARIGVTTGRFFVGLVGDAWRRELAVVGPAMNLAARFAFEGIDGVVADDTTRRLTEEIALYRDLGPTRIKGFAEPVARWNLSETWRRSRVTRAPDVIGRSTELAALARCLSDFEEGHDGVVTLSGPAGIGKSRCVAWLVARALQRGLRVAEVTGELADRDRPWAACRPLLEQSLGLKTDAPIDARIDALHEALTEAHGNADRAPLLAPALGIEIDDTRESVPLVGEARGHAAAELFAGCVARRLGSRGLIVVVDDAQWIDDASADALAALRTLLRPALVMLAVRVDDTALPDALQAMRANGSHIELGELRGEELGQFVALRLGVERAPDALVAWVRERAGGVPLFAGELAAALVDRGIVTVRDGEVMAVPDEQTLASVAPSITVEAIIDRRVESLDASAQLAVKVASVVGMRFSEEDLAPLHPGGVEAVRAHHEAVERAGLWLRSSPDTWTFGHRVTQDVAYGSMPGERRATLHGTLARHLEQRVPDDVATLAWHWERAGDANKALAALDAAFRAADKAGALVEARAIAQRAVVLLEAPGAARHSLAEGRWWRRLADISGNFGQYARVVDEATRAMQCLGAPFPTERGGWARRLLQSAATQLWRRVVPGASRTSGDDPLGAEMALACVRAGEGFYFVRNDPMASLACFLDAVNLGERAGVAGHVANGWGIVGTALLAMGLTRAGRYYLDRGLREVRAVGDERQLAYAQYHVGACAVMVGDWNEAEHALDESAAHGHRAGGFLVNNTWSVAAIAALLAGRLTRALDVAARIDALDAARRTPRGQAVATATRAMVQYLRGDAAGALTLASSAKAAFLAMNDLGWILPGAVAARASLCLNDTSAARNGAHELLDALRGSRSPDPRRLEGYAGAAEVFVALSARAPGDAALRASTDDALTLLARFARHHPLGGARAALLRGLAARHRGQRAAALAWLDRASRLATRYALPSEGARVQEALASLGAATTGALDAGRAWMRAEEVAPAMLTDARAPEGVE